MMSRKFSYFLLPIIFTFFNRCKSVPIVFPEIEQPKYSMYDRFGERGYFVHFKINEESNQPFAVVINGIKKDIDKEERKGNVYQVTVISETQKLHNYEIKTTNHPNGLLYIYENKEYFQSVDFILK